MAEQTFFHRRQGNSYQASATYSMSVFKLLLSLCEDLQKAIARFWWGGDGSERKIHWLRWEKLVQPKRCGGLGFRDLTSFNQALLAKQAWRLVQNPSALVSKVFRAKYYPTSSFMEAKIGNNGSYVWRSLVWGGELLKKGVRWRVGNGEKIRVFNSKWIRRPSLFKPITPKPVDRDNWKVSDFISNGLWNLDKLNSFLWPIDVVEILSIPLGRVPREDVLMWHFDKTGVYTVRSGY